MEAETAALRWSSLYHQPHDMWMLCFKCFTSGETFVPSSQGYPTSSIWCTATLKWLEFLFIHTPHEKGNPLNCCYTIITLHYSGSSSKAARQPLLFYVFLLLLLFSFNGSIWQPMECNGQKLWNLAHWIRTVPWSLTANLLSLAHEL